MLWDTMRNNCPCYGNQSRIFSPIVGCIAEDYSALHPTPRNIFILVFLTFIPCWKKMSTVWNKTWKYFPQCEIQSGKIYHSVKYNLEKFSTVWNIIWKNFPLCEIQFGKIFHSVKYNLERFSIVLNTAWNNVSCCGTKHGKLFCIVGYTVKYLPQLGILF